MKIQRGQLRARKSVNMKALVLQKPGHASIETIPEPVLEHGEILLKVRMVGFCGSDEFLSWVESAYFLSANSRPLEE